MQPLPYSSFSLFLFLCPACFLWTYFCILWLLSLFIPLCYYYFPISVLFFPFLFLPSSSFVLWSTNVFFFLYHSFRLSLSPRLSIAFPPTFYASPCSYAWLFSIKCPLDVFVSFCQAISTSVTSIALQQCFLLPFAPLHLLFLYTLRLTVTPTLSASQTILSFKAHSLSQPSCFCTSIFCLSS